jgi:phosphate:Na+ symporter
VNCVDTSPPLDYHHSMIIQLIGGLALFILGATLLSEGLKAAASDHLQRAIRRCTATLWRRLLTGFVTTTLLQSSSATTLIVIGLVGAGLLSFQNSIGVIFGANIGTTTTAWLVSLVGMKVSLTNLALPILAAGTLLRLSKRGRWADIGQAFAGFGLIFLGISTIQAAMAGLSGNLDLTGFPAAGGLERIAFAGVGVALTVIMQSSSAAVATALTALASGVLSLEQAGALIIGMNLGTTVTAALASIGRQVEVKRTAAAHTCFNLVTAAVMLPLLVPVMRVSSWIGAQFGGGDLVAAAIFHSSFNIIGVAICLPLIPAMVRWIERLLPEVKRPDVPLLNPAYIVGPAVAILEAARGLNELAGRRLKSDAEFLASTGERIPSEDPSLKSSLEGIYAYLGGIAIDPAKSEQRRAASALMHLMDHLGRLVELPKQLEAHRALIANPELKPLVDRTVTLLREAAELFEGENRGELLESAADLDREVAARLSDFRAEVLAGPPNSGDSTRDAFLALDGLRRLSAVVHHTARMSNYVYELFKTTS